MPIIDVVVDIVQVIHEKVTSNIPIQIDWQPCVHGTGSRVGRGGKTFLSLVFTGLNRLVEPHGGKTEKMTKTQNTKTAGFLVINCLKYTNVCLGITETYYTPCLIGFWL